MNEHLQELKVGGRPKRKWEIELEEKDKEIERLHSIIKEVRELVEKEEISITALDKGFGVLNQKDRVLEILDKVDKENI